MSDCTGLAGWLFGHKFEPVYNVTPPALKSVTFYQASEFIAGIERLSKREFATLYCPRCGKRGDKEATA